MNKAEFVAVCEAADRTHRDLWPLTVVVKERPGVLDPYRNTSVFLRGRWHAPELTHQLLYTPYPDRQRKFEAEVQEGLDAGKAMYQRWLVEWQRSLPPRAT